MAIASSSRRKPRIVTFARSYLPGHLGGGPIRSISNIVEHLGDEFDFRIVTRDRDEGLQIPYPGIETGVWLPVGRASVCYLGPGQQSKADLRKLIRATEPEAIYLNSVLDRSFAFPVMRMRPATELGIPTLMAPRGQFSPGALGLSTAKKRAFLWTAARMGWFRGLHWQATSELERRDILNALPQTDPASIIVASDLPTASGDRSNGRSRDEGAPLKVVFLSRIVEMKNLLGAISVLQNVSVPVEFTVIGPREDAAYWKLCQTALSRLPPNVETKVIDAVAPQDVVPAFEAHDVFLFPTLGENYGHVIHEALVAGCSVLVSDQTPWQDLEAAGAGWVLPLDDIPRWTGVLEELARLDKAQWSVKQQNVHRYLSRRLQDSNDVEINREMFRTLVAARVTA